jgi:cytochrome c553
MTRRNLPLLATALLGAAGLAVAQTPAPPPPPAFAASNLSEKGVRSLAATCSICHGTNGKAAPGATLAGLAGKPREEIRTALAQFKEGKKPATLMHQVSKGYSDAELDALADYFSKQPR